MPEFSFRDDGHIYTLDNVIIPSVTQTLAVKYFCDDWYKEKGKYVHEMAELYRQGRLDEDTLDEQLKPYLDALKKFEREAPHVKGIIDYKSGTFAKWHLLQTAAYRELWLNGIDENGNPLREIAKGFEVKGYHPVYRYGGKIDIVDIADGDKFPPAFALYLQDTGRYKLEPVTDIRRHIQAFLTLVTAGYIREEYKI